jgi:hypothetical protein
MNAISNRRRTEARYCFGDEQAIPLTANYLIKTDHFWTTRQHAD